MSNSDLRYDIIGIGNAIVDIISHETEDFLIRHQLVKDSMSLVDEQAASAIYDENENIKNIVESFSKIINSKKITW